MTVKQLLRNISSVELTEWIAYLKVKSDIEKEEIEKEEIEKAQQPQKAKELLNSLKNP